jgi:hypothetical protein
LIGGQAVQRTGQDNRGLSFEIPATAVHQVADRVTPISATLRVPRYTCSLLHWFNCKQVSEFSIPLVVLPASPGSLVFTTLTSRQDYERVHRVYPANSEYRQESNDDDIPDPVNDGKQWCVPPDPGYEVEPESVEHVETWGEGDRTWDHNSSNRENACWNLITRHHRIGTSGKSHFKIGFWERRRVTVPVETPADVQLTWLSSRVLSLPQGSTWKARFVQFDGHTFEFSSADTHTPFLTVIPQPTSVEFVTIP